MTNTEKQSIRHKFPDIPSVNKIDERTVRMGDEGPLHNKNRKHTCIHAVTRVQNLFADTIRIGLDYPTDKMLEDMVRDAEWNALWNPREIAEQHDQDMKEMRRIWNMALGANVVEESELISEREKVQTFAAALDEIATTGADTLEGYEAANIATAALAKHRGGKLVKTNITLGEKIQMEYDEQRPIVQQLRSELEDESKIIRKLGDDIMELSRQLAAGREKNECTCDIDTICRVHGCPKCYGYQKQLAASVEALKEVRLRHNDNALTVAFIDAALAKTGGNFP